MCWRSSSGENARSAKVVKVIDGDTIDCVFPDGCVRRIRYENIDAPELKESGGAGQDSKMLNEKLVMGKEVGLTGKGSDKYHRLLRRVSVDGQDVGELLVRQGVARAWKSD